MLNKLIFNKEAYKHIEKNHETRISTLLNDIDEFNSNFVHTTYNEKTSAYDLAKITLKVSELRFKFVILISFITNFIDFSTNQKLLINLLNSFTELKKTLLFGLSKLKEQPSETFPIAY